MKLSEYIKDRGVFLAINIILFFIIAIMMGISKIGSSIIFLTFVIWFLPLLSYITVEFIKYKKYYSDLIRITEELDKKYLISEVMKEPEFIEGKIIHNILKDTNRDMQEHVKYYKNMQKDYQEYIETWVHEIKTPIASAMLIIENNEDNIPSSMKNEIKKVEDYIDQVLYYSRSNDVSKDYIVKSFNLETNVRNVIRKNASDFINKRISVDIENLSGIVYSDPKWVEFIINQIIGNSIKYSNNHGKIKIYSVINNNNIILSIEDNGVGISEIDVNRVFEKGFTGENGRIFGKSTGIGLYLCKRLCEKLGLGISLKSKKNQGTQVNIVFPIGKTYNIDSD